MSMSQIAWLSSLIACVCMAVLGQAELIGEPWRHYVTIVSVVATAASAFMLQRPAPKWDGIDRRE